MRHEQFQDLLDGLVRSSGVGQEVLGEVMARTCLRAPAETSRVEISAGNPAARRPIMQRALPQGTVSKAVKALMDIGLLESGERMLRSPDGRSLAPLRLGSVHAIAGAHITLSGDQPKQVTTALTGLDYSIVLGSTHNSVDSWEQVAGLIDRHVSTLKAASDDDRATRGLMPLRMFGVGVEVLAPVYAGEVMPLGPRGSRSLVRLSAEVCRLIETDPSFDRPVPVVVENSCNALAVLGIHDSRTVEADMVVIGVFDEGVGGGLVMDSQLRRGSNGQAMEIGHLSVEVSPGYVPETHELYASDDQADRSSEFGVGFNRRCFCGHFRHINTLATPSCIQEEFGDGTLEQMSEIEADDQRFQRARDIFIRSGAALGRALAHVSNTVNPSNVIIYLPATLGDPKPDTAAAAYLTAARTEVGHAFAAYDRPNYLTVRMFPAKPEDAALMGAKAAAACVLEGFIEHALRLDGCSSSIRRVASGSQTYIT